MTPKINAILSDIQGLTPIESLKYFAEKFNGKIVFSTSFGMEDQVISDFILKNKIPIEIFTLDTGRLFPETYSVWEQTNMQYQTDITPFYPPTGQIENYVKINGINAFYNSAELRKECCHIRKVVPLKRALHGMEVWVTGLRAEQSLNREKMQKVEWDEGNQIIKFHPILDWNTEQVLSYLRSKGVPYNSLHDKGFISIGCQPCTRAIKNGEDFRAGRWWWEDKSKKECGLHSV